ncbi:lipid-A-disaccharide synthase [Agarivorans sp. B2Z047]|uniref:lipid-A-disaccharide synthase n=1 Tax=Agarivorans sp. B2Z047 TaxID=2652721 RepID=UPI00128B5F2E|nr:lipid-A-disaccharide synthase [Agarivorans sp. B2Z047]MPW27402.1 lipid-A-disaccharide synthase [Agarivorans sp. B2Z047]UQN44755.1 lipid-A-disaccharide synthase [Agarivorans sp. B2Z047]
MAQADLHIAIVAGEVSGDILGAGLISALKQQYPNARFSGIAGALMQEQGCEALFDMEELSVMGLVEVLGRLPRILKIRKQLLQQYIQSPPDIYIGIDAPDFNLGVEHKLHAKGVKTVHYVSPSVWAWKQKRVFKIKEGCNKILVFLPFEKAFYDRFEVPCEFVGHTLADQVPLESPKLPAIEQLGLDSSRKVLAILPGSRNAEVGLLTPVFLESAKKLLEQYPDLQLVAPLVNQRRREQFEALVNEHAPELDIKVIDGQARTVMTAADAILLASGTATLEAMLVKRPMVVAYRFKPLTYRIAKLIVNAKFAALPNLLADKMIVQEYVQEDCTSDNIVAELSRLLESDNSKLIDKFTELHQQIRCDADHKAAQAVIEVINS